jgi:hypothetical protein
MNTTAIVSALEELARSSSRRESVRLKEIFDSIEASLAAGVTRIQVLESLHQNGFTMSINTFNTTIYRIRQQKRRNTGAAHKPKKTKEVSPEKAPTTVALNTAPSSNPLKRLSDQNVSRTGDTRREILNLPKKEV